MPENYDNPPASSRRPSLPNSASSIRRRQRLLDHLRARRQREQSARDSERERAASEEDEEELDGLLSDSQLLEEPFSQLLDRLVDQDPEGTPRDIHPPQRPRDRMLYLRNLIHSEAHRTDSEATLRALETLNREIEDHYLDEARNGNMTFTQAQAALDDHRRMFGVDNPRSATPTFQQYVQRLPSTISPANLEPRTPSNRTIRRRPFRPDLRDSFPTPSLMPQTPSTGRDRERDRDLDRRLKRRKLDADDNREGSRGFNYGHQGQVVPGPLKMEIASCDGGIIDTDGDCSFPDNVLRSDQSVYSTKSDRCNLILRHKDEAPFCLRKLVIKAPRAGSFDNPIQEGMIFVSMSSDELLARTAQYQMQYSNRRHRRRERRLGLQPSQEYLNPSARPSHQAAVERTVLVSPDSSLASTLESGGQDTPDPQTQFRVTTDYDDTTDENVFVHRADDDMLPSVAQLERVNEDDDLLCSDSEDSASDDDEDDNSIHNLVRRRRMENQRRIISARRQALESSQRRRPPSLVDPIPPPSHPTPPVIPASSAEVLKPYARFFIERERSMVSIKFDPPPSGRFILIKLWSPRSGSNIDVQSIIAHGYAGPRFFPSGGFR